MNVKIPSYVYIILLCTYCDYLQRFNIVTVRFHEALLLFAITVVL